MNIPVPALKGLTCFQCRCQKKWITPEVSLFEILKSTFYDHIYLIYISLTPHQPSRIISISDWSMNEVSHLILPLFVANWSIAIWQKKEEDSQCIDLVVWCQSTHAALICNFHWYLATELFVLGTYQLQPNIGCMTLLFGRKAIGCATVLQSFRGL